MPKNGRIVYITECEICFGINWHLSIDGNENEMRNVTN